MSKVQEKKVKDKQLDLNLLLKEDVMKAIESEENSKNVKYEVACKNNEIILITTIEQRIDLGKIKRASKAKKATKGESKTSNKSLIETLATPASRKRKSITASPKETKKASKKQDVSED